MKHLKQIFSIVLLIALLGNLTVFAQKSQGELAAEELVTLGILAGDEEGNLLLGKTVTRAEMAVIVCRLLALEDVAIKTRVLTSSFSDVPTTHWAAGYLEVVKAQGIINGYPDGTFCPEKEVSYAEVLKMLITSCGYLPKANKMGCYPAGVMAVAMQNGLTKDVAFSQDNAATREDVACFVLRALDLPIMVQTGYGVSEEYQLDPEVTLRSQNFKVKQ